MKFSQKFIITFSGFCILFLFAFIPQNLPKKFQDLLDRDQLSFHASDSLIQVPIKENKQMNYNYAIAYPSQHFEIRYTIRPKDSAILQYKKDSAKGRSRTPPQDLYKAAFMATSFNVLQSKRPHIKPFLPRSVQKEFNADWGGITAGHPKGKFGEGFSFCFIVFLHKRDVGNAYIYYLADSTIEKSEFGAFMRPEFHNIRFQ